MRVTPWTVLSVLLILVGIGYWIQTGIANAAWTDIGVYSVVVLLVGFGVLGLLASLRAADAT